MHFLRIIRAAGDGLRAVLNRSAHGLEKFCAPAAPRHQSTSLQAQYNNTHLMVDSFDGHFSSSSGTEVEETQVQLSREDLRASETLNGVRNNSTILNTRSVSTATRVKQSVQPYVVEWSGKESLRPKNSDVYTWTLKQLQAEISKRKYPIPRKQYKRIVPTRDLFVKNHKEEGLLRSSVHSKKRNDNKTEECSYLLVRILFSTTMLPRFRRLGDSLDRQQLE